MSQRIARAAEGQIAAQDPFYEVKPKSAWLRVTNMETPGRFQVILEVTDDLGVTRDKPIYDSMAERDCGLIGHHINLTWLIKRAL